MGLLQVVIDFTEPFARLGLGPSALRVLYLVAGVILLLVGWRLADYVVGLAGFVIGAAIGLSLAPPGDEVISVLALVLGGLLGAALAVALQYVAIFVIGAYLGAMLTSQLWVALATGAVPTWALILGAIVGGLLLLALSFQLLVVVSAAVGALLIGLALELPVVWMLVLLVVGILLQVILASASGRPIVYRRTYRRRVYRAREVDI